MAVKIFNATSPGQRHRLVSDFDEVTSRSPEKSLLAPRRRKAGRNNLGRITVRHRGGGNARRYRLVDFKRFKDGVEGVVKSVEYDPNRSAFISLVQYRDGEKRYVVAPKGLTVGSVIVSGPKADIKIGNTLPLGKIPPGTEVHNIELSIGRGGQLARSAGAFGVVMAKNNRYATIKLPSGEVRLVNVKCRATVGQLGNQERRNTMRGKAGATRWAGFRPAVRGSVMNPCDHPHGGGEGKAPIGRPGPVTPWGKPTLGYKTRNAKKVSKKYILERRK